MTLILALRGVDGIVLAADSRGTFGDPRLVTAQNDNQEKAFILSRHVGALTSGAGELASLLIQEATGSVQNQGLDGVAPVMNVVRETMIRRFNEFFPGFMIQPMQGVPAPVRPSLGLIVAGYDLAPDGETAAARLYSLNSENNFAPFLHDYGFSLQGVPQYALYLLNRLYDAQASIRELTALATYAITETASQDGKVGGPVRIITITPERGCEALEEKQVADVLKQNERRSQGLKDSFFGRPMEGEPRNG